ncbi:hypothetical protein NG819_02635 [Pseudarthrobacter sp. Fe7]|nr:hypothetical protein NG819_02635 [Pseudarthrobacter sp. Fe7]
MSADGNDAEPRADEKPARAVAGAASTLAVPIGEGNSSLGIIWIAMMDRPRTWSSAEPGADPARGRQRRVRAHPKPPDQQPAAGGEAAARTR